MRDVEKYVDKLFAGEAATEEINDLKMEIISNLEARIEDNIAKGMDEQAAFTEATANVKSIDGLLDHRRTVLRYPYFKDLLQTALIYLLVALIIVAPLRLSMTLVYISKGLIGAIIVVGILYLINYTDRKDTTILPMDVAKLKIAKRWTWLLWGLFMVVKTLLNIGIRFGSTIWYGRSVNIEGPYQWLMLVVSFILPVLTILIPLMVRYAYLAVRKHEVNDDE